MSTFATCGPGEAPPVNAQALPDRRRCRLRSWYQKVATWHGLDLKELVQANGLGQDENAMVMMAPPLDLEAGLQDMPALFLHRAVSCGGRTFIFGGKAEVHESEYRNDVWVRLPSGGGVVSNVLT